MASAKLVDLASGNQNDLWGPSMKIPRQLNQSTQSRMIFRADWDLKDAGDQRNEPMATLTRTIR